MSRSDTRSTSGSVYRTEYDPSDADIGVDIARGVAAVRGEDPGSSPFVLADYVDPDAIDALCRSQGSDWRFDIEVADCHVTLHGDGEIVVRPSSRPRR